MGHRKRNLAAPLLAGALGASAVLLMGQTRIANPVMDLNLKSVESRLDSVTTLLEAQNDHLAAISRAFYGQPPEIEAQHIGVLKLIESLPMHFPRGR